MCKILIAIYFLLAGCCLQLNAQPPAIFFDHITTKDGLSNNFVNTIVKDRKGFLWIGTSDGLNRYDGKNFISFYHSIYDKNSISHNDVYCLLEDNIGYIWVGTFNGLCRLNPYTNEITRMGASDPDTAFLTIGDVKQNTHNGAIWVCTNKGLYWVNQKKNELVRAADNEPGKPLSQTFINKMLVSEPDSFWLATYDGLVRYCPSTGKYRSYKVPSHTALATTYVKSIYMDKSKKLWLCTWGRGLQSFDPLTGTFKRFLPREDLGERSDANIIYNITQTGYPGEDHILWIAADAAGLLAFNMQTGKFKAYSSNDVNNRRGLYGHGISFCLSEPEGLWIGGSNGLYRYDPHHQLFRHLNLAIDPARHCLKEILSVYADPQDVTGKTLLAGTWSCGAYRLSLKDGSVTPLPEWIMDLAGSSRYISAFHRDEDGMLWIGTNNNGIHKVDEKKKTSKAYQLPATGKRTSSVELLFATSKDSLWIATVNGLFLLNKRSETITPIFSKEVTSLENISYGVRAITVDKKRNIWFCTNLRVNEKPVVGKVATNGKVTLYYNISGQKGSFPENSPLQGITCDSRNNIWCASWNGLVYWNAAEETPVFNRLTRTDGLCNDKVFKVEADRQGYVWAATLRGLSCYDPGTRSFNNYYTSEGLHRDVIANFFTNNITGEIIAGYEGVMDIADPSYAHRKSTPPPIEITGVKVFNQPYSNDKKSYINKGVVDLSPGQNMITISFSALSFTDPHEVKYSYKLEGVDEDWITTGNDVVTYHNLPPGSRKFFVRSRNADGIWSAETTWVDIELAPPFYRTWWFVLLVIAVVVTVAYFIYRERIRRLEEKFRIRSVIARDLHDEIGSTLTSINILSRVSRSNIEKDHEKAAGLLQKITEQSQDMQQSMSDIIWAIRPDNDKLENMAARMREYLSQTLEAKDIAIQFEADEQVLKESLSMEQRRDFFLIFKEAVNNAAKYSRSAAVAVSLKKDRNCIELSICDEGIGFDVTKKHTTNGLKNMQSRAASLKAALVITSAPGKGTRVELNIPV